VSPLILVVDDERGILSMIEEDLTKHGYRVVTADRSESAMEAFCTLYPRPDLLLVDVVMPGMSGPMMVEKLREMDPHIPVLFMSGYHERQVVQRYVLEQGFRIMMKPFSLNELRETVKQALANTPKPQPENFIH
jgi:two-component system cell cycle sensor histidine kinase/response regulator CckA